VFALRRHSRRARRTRLCVEPLEARDVPSGTPAPHAVISDAAPLAVDFADASGSPAVVQATVAGAIGSSDVPSADVAWYTFTLDRAASVTLTSQSSAGTVLSLYNTDGLSDPYDPLGHRLLAQSGAAGSTTLSRHLGPGTYDIAVSGLGNNYFNPYMADSGYAGSSGPYQLTLSATALTPAAPQVLTADVAADPTHPQDLSRSPFEIYLGLSDYLTDSVVAGLNVQLTALSDPATNLVSNNPTYSATADELQLQLTQPLGPGSYQLTVSDAVDPSAFQAYATTFQITGTEGIAGSSVADNTPATAHQLNFVNGFAQATGAIGDDPTDALPFDPNSVEAYHFQVTQQAPYALVAEVFAGRVGSPLQPALSLFQDVDGQLHLVSTNSGSFNDTPAVASSPVATPLQNDPVLYAALGQGDYYLVVSEVGNAPDPFAGDTPFDPNASLDQTGLGGGSTTGPYVLNVSLQENQTPPQVVSVTALGSSAQLGSAPLTQPPAAFVVRFSEAVNIQQLVYQEGSSSLSAFYVEGPGGPYQPELASYDPATYTATYSMGDRLDPGTYTLHMVGSGANGITDLAGNPLVGNGPDGPAGDYTVSFSVTGAGRSTSFTETANSAASPQDLGTQAPFELQQGVVVTGTFAGEAADYYQFQVLQTRQFFIGVTGLPEGTSPIPTGDWLTVTDLTTGQAVPVLVQGFRNDTSQQVNNSGFVQLLVPLNPGDTYVVAVTSWGAGTTYALQLSNANYPEAPPPLTVGPAPAIRQQLVSQSAPPAEVPPPSPPPPAPTEIFTIVIAAKENGPVSLPTLSGIPQSILVNLGTGPLGLPGGITAVPVAPSVFELIFARDPGSGSEPALIGVEIFIDLPDNPADAPTSGQSPPQGRLERVPPETSTQLWRWLADQLGPMWSLPLEGTSAENGSGSEGGPTALMDDADALETGTPAAAVSAVFAALAAGREAGRRRFGPGCFPVLARADESCHDQ
jgi:hypothetical protein